MTIGIDGMPKTYAAGEHFYRSMKFYKTDPEWAEEIRKASTPAEAKSKGSSTSHIISPNWDKNKDEVMRVCLKNKIRCNPNLRTKLIETGDAILIEDSPTDYYWGCGKTGAGKNMLSKLWMELRSNL
jgi:ribA/ribD-fused uncharacterized protein